MAKEIACPHCKKSIIISKGFKHDKNLNFICSCCDKPIFGVTEEAEKEIKKNFIIHPASAGFHSAFAKKEPLPIKIQSVEVEQNTAQNSVQETKSDDSEELPCFC